MKFSLCILLCQVFNILADDFFIPNIIGTSNTGRSGQAGAITYSTTYGCNYSIAGALKLAPATTDSVAGNLPSDDLSGFAAINKVRIKMQIYVSNEDTSYTGFWFN